MLRLQAGTTTIWFLWQTSVATGIKGVCHHHLICKADQCGSFNTLILRKTLCTKIQVKYHYISPFCQKWKKGKAITNIRKLYTISARTIYINNVYSTTISTSTLSSPSAFDKFGENTLYLSYLGESNILHIIYFLS